MFYNLSRFRTLLTRILPVTSARLVALPVAMLAVMLTALPAAALSGRLVMADTVLTAGAHKTMEFRPGEFRSAELCGSFIRKKGKGPEGHWGMELLGEDGSALVSANVVPEQTVPGDFDSDTRIVVSAVSRGGKSVAENVVDRYGKTDGLLTVSIRSVGDGLYEVAAGVGSYEVLGVFQAEGVPSGLRIEATDTDVEVRSLNLAAGEYVPSRMGLPASCGAPGGVIKLNPDSCAGAGMAAYRYLDYETDSRMALRGGDYCLGLLLDGKGGFDIIYLSGAERNAADWEAGMVKGKLVPTVFSNHYDLKWTDADFRTDIEGAWGEFAQEGYLLVLHFPREKGLMRFYREPPQR